MRVSLQNLQFSEGRFESLCVIDESEEMGGGFIGCEDVGDGCSISFDSISEYMAFLSVLWAVK